MKNKGAAAEKKKRGRALEKLPRRRKAAAADDCKSTGKEGPNGSFPWLTSLVQNFFAGSLQCLFLLCPLHSLLDVGFVGFTLNRFGERVMAMEQVASVVGHRAKSP